MITCSIKASGTTRRSNHDGACVDPNDDESSELIIVQVDKENQAARRLIVPGRQFVR
jgi:hypothetical protein